VPGRDAADVAGLPHGDIEFAGPHEAALRAPDGAPLRARYLAHARRSVAAAEHVPASLRSSRSSTIARANVEPVTRCKPRHAANAVDLEHLDPIGARDQVDAA
jgi:hypothetical protein